MDKDDNGNAIDNGNDNDINNYKGNDGILGDQIQDQEKVLDFKLIIFF